MGPIRELGPAALLSVKAEDVRALEEKVRIRLILITFSSWIICSVVFILHITKSLKWRGYHCYEAAWCDAIFTPILLSHNTGRTKEFISTHATVPTSLQWPFNNIASPSFTIIYRYLPLFIIIHRRISHMQYSQFVRVYLRIACCITHSGPSSSGLLDSGRHC